MCSQYDLLSNDFNNQDNPYNIDLDFNARIRGFVKTDLAPVVVFENGKATVREMFFSLCPSWSKEFPFKASTYNARMARETKMKDGNNVNQKIFEAPTWRTPFKNGQTCLVPMSNAIESSYFGSYAGQMIRIMEKNSSVFYTCGLWDSWLNKDTGELIYSFTIITDSPYRAFFDAGHDRSILLIDKEKQIEWIENKKLKPIERFNFLKDNRSNIDWKIETEREMKTGWEKRAPSDKEISEIEVWD